MNSYHVTPYVMCRGVSLDIAAAGSTDSASQYTQTDVSTTGSLSPQNLTHPHGCGAKHTAAIFFFSFGPGLLHILGNILFRSFLTLCRPDGLLIKCPQFPDF